MLGFMLGMVRYITDDINRAADALGRPNSKQMQIGRCLQPVPPPPCRCTGHPLNGGVLCSGTNGRVIGTRLIEATRPLHLKCTLLSFAIKPPYLHTSRRI